MKQLTSEQIAEIAQFDTPTIANAIELFKIGSRLDGVMNPEIKCILPFGKTMVGYAYTAKISAAAPATTEQPQLWMDYFAKLQSTPRPSLAVLQDIDPQPVGSFWGEVNATCHKALGCVGTITNGGVRDLNEVEELGFGFFASTVLVSHGYVHIEEHGIPVEIGGVTVNPGDLLAADRHGVILIPHGIAEQLADACIQAGEAELPVLNGCRKALAENAEVNLDELKQWRKEMAENRQLKS
ncbi:MAG: RraA family protein [Ruminococcaceae bacterium]|nr:RraA family protein [Oscillospiraceae bacterium]